MPVRPHPLTPHFPYLFYTRLFVGFPVFLSVGLCLSGACNIRLIRAPRPLPASVIPHMHRSILVSVTASRHIFSCLFVVGHVSAPYTNDGLTIGLTNSPLAPPASFCHTTLHRTSSNFSMLHSIISISIAPFPSSTIYGPNACQLVHQTYRQSLD